MSRRTRGDLHLLLAGAGMSTAGSAVTTITVLLHVRPLGPGWVAAVLAAGLLPAVVLSPVAGLLIDRVRNGRLLVTSLLVAAGGIVAVATGGLVAGNEAVLIVGLVVVGVAAAVATPTVAALLPVIAGEARATRAYGYYGAITQGGFLAGAALGGVLVEVLGTRTALLVDAASFALMAAAVAAMRTERVPLPASDRRRVRGRRGSTVWAGFELIGADRLLRVAVVGLSGVILASIVINVAEVFFALEDLGLSPAGFGLLSACWPMAGVIGGWCAGRLSSDKSLVVGLAAGGVAMGGGVALAGWSVSVPVVAVAWAVAGAANAAQVVCINALVRSRSARSERGRAFAALGAVLQTANVTGLVVSSVAVAVLGARVSLVVAGLATVVVAVVTFVLSRHHVEQVPDHRRPRSATADVADVADVAVVADVDAEADAPAAGRAVHETAAVVDGDRPVTRRVA